MLPFLDCQYQYCQYPVCRPYCFPVLSSLLRRHAMLLTGQTNQLL
jgi:hypothetical protein